MAIAGGSGTVTIASGASLSNAIAINGEAVGIIMPGAWTTAALSFAVSDSEDGTYVPLYDSANAEVTVASAGVVASRAISLDGMAAKLAPWAYMKIRSGLVGAAVTQSADRVLSVQTK